MNKSQKVCLLFTAAAAGLFLLPASGEGASCLGTPGYSCTTINDQADNNPPVTATPETFTQLLGINDSNTIVGYYGSGTLPDHPNKGIVISNAFASPTVFTHENFPGSVQTQVVGLNNLSSPTTVGFWVDAAGNNFGFYKIGSTFTTVPTPAGETGTVNQLLGVNNSNMAVGFYTDSAGNNHGYLFNIASSTLTPITLPSSFTATSFMATGINNSGWVSGVYTDSTGATHGFIDVGGTITSYDDPHGTNTGFFGINNLGDVVGSYTDSTGISAGLWFDPATHTWLTVDDPNESATPAFGFTGTILNGLNDANDLVGFYVDANGGVDGLLASVPEPASLGLMGLAMLAAGCIYRRKRRNS